MEGVYLSALIPLLDDLITGGVCLRVGQPVKEGLGLVFDRGMLVICARPGSPGLWWDVESPMSDTLSPAWDQHIKGAEVVGTVQQGADRVLEIHFSSRLLYGASDTRLVFEATGRNANLILLRREDGRILACQRRVTSSDSRYRTVAPGQVYVPPPPSGLSPGSWSADPAFSQAIGKDPSPQVLYRMLEGVGPVTARAILREAVDRSTGVLEVVRDLENALIEKRFFPWEGAGGPLPVRLGPGRPVADPLSPGGGEDTRTIREDRLEVWRSILGSRLSYQRRRLARLETALDGLVSPDEYRTWGSLLLSVEDGKRKGLNEIRLTDWEGVDHVIPLKPFRTLRAGAARFFRKASSIGRERKNLESLRETTLKEIGMLEGSLDESGELGVGELEENIRGDRMERKRERDGKNLLQATELSGGWRCFVGRNARQNEDVTFGIGRRGDLWFHARGIPGAHVVLKLDGRAENPPGSVIREAAGEAARSSGVSSGVVAVDYTRVQYVNRMKKGKPGQVTYTREKTIFVDMDGKSSGTR
ncbi:MAG: NFACT family protein [Candidatus Fermentibacteraceae bacterium]|nr:NFACT family protein [Candidatus Fermentibacteraceae bacterium]MBN2609528.1 NFACT family protein [Candidatus Fermentibacteraceae bacterium]